MKSWPVIDRTIETFSDLPDRFASESVTTRFPHTATASSDRTGLANEIDCMQFVDSLCSSGSEMNDVESRLVDIISRY